MGLDYAKNGYNYGQFLNAKSISMTFVK